MGKRTPLKQWEVIGHTATRPFMLGDAPEYEPNQYYRSWLEKHIGRQYKDWNWDISGTDIDYLEIYFKKEEDGLLFELTWQ
jgi:hypothetical protein